MTLVASITGCRKDWKGEPELFDLHMTSGLTVIGMRLCHNSEEHWIDFPATQYAKDGDFKHFAFLRAPPGLRNELNRECLEHLGVIEEEPRLV